MDDDFEAAFKTLPRAFPNLLSLQLGDSACDADMAHLRHLGGLLTQLKELHLSGCAGVSDWGLHLAAPLTALTRLDLSGASSDQSATPACTSFICCRTCKS